MSWGCGEFGDVIPRAEARVDLGVVDRVEAGVRAVKRGEERQDMNAVIHAVEAGAQNVGHAGDGAVAETIRVGDELNCVLHGNSCVVFPVASALFLPGLGRVR